MPPFSALRLVGGQRIQPSGERTSVLANLEVNEMPSQRLGEGEILTEPLFVGVCGSDVSAALGKPNFAWVQRPRTIGHECSARVIELGPGVAVDGDIAVGDTVCVVPMLGCGDGRCRGCGRGRPNYCRRKTIFGFHRDGAFARQMVVEAKRCMRVRDDLTARQGAVIEPLSVVAQGIHRKCNIQPGMDVVVSGCGIIGMMSAELARAAGARVAVTGLPQDRAVRLQLAEQRGFITIEVSEDLPLHQQLTEGIFDDDGNQFGDEYEQGSVDVLIECSGAPAALATAGLSVQFEGTICVIATFPREIPFEATKFTRSGQIMTGVMGSNREDFQLAQKLLAEDVFPAEDYSREYAFTDVEDAMFDSITGRATKALVAVNE